MERDKYMSPTEAKEFGLIDNILKHPLPETGSPLPEQTSNSPVMEKSAANPT